MPLVSILALNWNGKKFIDPLMKSVKELVHDNFDIEFLFIDNDSSDGSAEYYTEKYCDDMTYRIVRNDKNYGYAKGNNLGMDAAKGEYIVVCNNDLILDKYSIQELLAAIESTGAALTVPKLMFLNKPGYINNAGSTLDPSNSWPVTEIGMNEKDNGQYDQMREVTAFCGACVMFTRDFLKTVGVYDDRFFMYFEDSDLSWRGQSMKNKYIYTPKAIAHHYHTGTSIEGSKKFNYFVARNRVLILLKNAKWHVVGIGYKFAIRDHLYYRLKNTIKATLGRYPKRQALSELTLGIRTMCGILWNTPYALLKRWNVIKERKI